MPTPSPPVKTALGQDELRHRTHRLGQRHRTVLLLVDGHRSLGDILAMAHQAGAQTSHFEELLHLGLIEMPAPVAPPEAPETAPGSLDIPKLSSVVLDVPADELPTGGEPPATPPSPPALATRDTPEPAPLASWAPTPEPAWPEVPEAERPSLTLPAAAAPVESAAPPRKRRRSPSIEAPPPSEPARLTPAPADWLIVRTQPVEMDAATASEAGTQGLDEVRGLLVHALGADAALFAPLALHRVRTAPSTRELIGLVWDIERHRGHSLRGRSQLLSLDRARELLGMGNTQVSGDSQPGDGWHDTDPAAGDSR